MAVRQFAGLVGVNAPMKHGGDKVIVKRTVKNAKIPTKLFTKLDCKIFF